MALIKPRTRGKGRLQHRTRLDRENHEVLYAYAAFTSEDAEYVLNELIDTVLAKDKEFVRWRAEHPESFAPRAAAARVPRSGGAPPNTPTSRASSSPAREGHVSHG